ncbi:uncharacterized protein LOC124154342 [Ischnura elegans]|uniref:uncharacterized protein LOC124154342 n=1 Tax=Ischnura elegans TaxID=197161 RepID=UPI001ED8ACE5|nr:uncharacterized protein LOC124154342 [Ischnura elegans]
MSMAVMGGRLDFRICIYVALLISSQCECRTFEISLDTDKALQKLSPYFLSITLDPIILIDQAAGGRQIKDGFDTVRAMNMARGLSPAFLRLGGPSTDEGVIRFQAYTDDEDRHGDSLLGGFQGDGDSPKPIMTVNGAQLTLLNHFAEDSGLKLIVSLGYDHKKQQRKAKKRAKGLMEYNDDESDMDSWDTKQALDIIRFANSNNMDLGYQLGYEAYYLNGSKIPLSKDNKLRYDTVDFEGGEIASDADIVKREAENAGLGLGMDLVRLRSLIDAYPYSRGAQLFSPGICLPSEILHGDEHSEDPTSQKGKHLQSFLQAFVGRADDALTAVVLHPYEYDMDAGDKAKGKKNKSDAVPQGSDGLMKVLGHSVGQKPICIGESWKNKVECKESPEGVSDLDEALKWAQHLGKSAQMGANVILHSPKADALQNPDTQYWVSLLHKKLAGDTVLETGSSEKNGVGSNFYAHCTPRTESYPMIVDSFPHGSVTLYAVNPTNDSVHAVFRGFSEYSSLSPDDGDIDPVVYEYVLTEYVPKSSSKNKSRGTLLNGRLLKMDDNGDLPFLAPKEIPINLGERKKCRIGEKGKGNTAKNKISLDEGRQKRRIANGRNKDNSVGEEKKIPLHLPAKSVAFWVLPPSTGVKPCLERVSRLEWKDFIPDAGTNKIKLLEPTVKKSKGGKNTGKSGVVMRKDIKNPVEAHECSIMHRRRRDLPQLTLPKPILDIPTPAVHIPRTPLLQRLRSLADRRAKLGLHNPEFDLSKLRARLRNQRTKTPYIPKVISFGYEEETEEPSTGNAYESGVAYLSEEKPAFDDGDEYRETEVDDTIDNFGEDGKDIILPEEVEEFAPVSSRIRRESVEAEKAHHSGSLPLENEEANDSGLYLENIDEYNVPFSIEKLESEKEDITSELFEAELPKSDADVEEDDEALLAMVQPQKDNSLPKFNGESDGEENDFGRDSVIVIEEAKTAAPAGDEVANNGSDSTSNEEVANSSQNTEAGALEESDYGYSRLYTMNDPIDGIEGQENDKLFEEVQYDEVTADETAIDPSSEGNIENQEHNNPTEINYELIEQALSNPGIQGNIKGQNGDNTLEDDQYGFLTEEGILTEPVLEGKTKDFEMQDFARDNGGNDEISDSEGENPTPEIHALKGKEVSDKSRGSVADKIAEFLFGISPSESSTEENKKVAETELINSGGGTKSLVAEIQSNAETLDDRTYEEVYSQIPAGNFDSELSWVANKRDAASKTTRRRRRRDVNAEDSSPDSASSSIIEEKGLPIQIGETSEKVAPEVENFEQNPNSAEKATVNQNAGGLKDNRGIKSEGNPSIKSEPFSPSKTFPPQEKAPVKLDISSSSAAESPMPQVDKSDVVIKTTKPSSGSTASFISPQDAMDEENVSIFKSIKDVVHGTEDEKLYRLSRASAEEIRTPAEIARRLHLPDRVVFNLDPRSQQLQSAKDNETLSTTTEGITTTTTAAPAVPNDVGTKERANVPSEEPSHPVNPITPEKPPLPTLPPAPTPPPIPELPKLPTGPPPSVPPVLRSRPTLPTLPPIRRPALPAIPPRPRADAPERPQLVPVPRSRPTLPTLPPIKLPTFPAVPPRPRADTPEKSQPVPIPRSRPTLPTLPPIKMPTLPAAPPRPRADTPEKAQLAPVPRSRPTLPTLPTLPPPAQRPRIPSPGRSSILKSAPPLPTLPPIVRNFTRPTRPTAPPKQRTADAPTRPTPPIGLKSRPLLPALPRPTLTPTPNARASDTRKIQAPGGLAVLKSRPPPPTLPPIVLPTLPPLSPKARKIEARTRPTLLPVAPGRTIPARPSTIRSQLPQIPPATTTKAPTTTTAATTTTTTSNPEVHIPHRNHRTISDAHLARARPSSLELAAREQHRQLRRQMEEERRKLILDAAADSKLRTLEALTKRLTRDVGAQDGHGLAGRAADAMRQLSDNLATPLMKFWQDMRSRITHLREELEEERKFMRRRRSTASDAQRQWLEDEKSKILAEMAKSTLKKKEEEKKPGELHARNRLRRDVLGMKDGDLSRLQYHGVASKLEDLLRRRRQLVQSPGLFQMPHFRPKRKADWGKSDDKEWPVDHEFMYYPSDGSDEYTEIRMGHEDIDEDSLDDWSGSDISSDVDDSYFAVDTARRGLYPIGPYGVLNHLYAQGELYKMEDALNDSEDHEIPWDSNEKSETGQERSNHEDGKTGKPNEEDAKKVEDAKGGKTSDDKSSESKESKEKSKEHATMTPETHKKEVRRRRWTVNMEGNAGNELGWPIGDKPISYDIDLMQKDEGVLTNKIMRFGAEGEDDSRGNVFLLALRNRKLSQGQSQGDAMSTAGVSDHVGVETTTFASSKKRTDRDGESRVQKIPLKSKTGKEEADAKAHIEIASSKPVVSAAAAMGVANNFMSQIMNNMTELINFFRSMIGWSRET